VGGAACGSIGHKFMLSIHLCVCVFVGEDHIMEHYGGYCATPTRCTVQVDAEWTCSVVQLFFPCKPWSAAEAASVHPACMSVSVWVGGSSYELSKKKRRKNLDGGAWHA
jgi:hypothetical protein